MTLVKPPAFLSRLAHPLTGNVRQVIVFIVRFTISPHDKDNLEPLCSQSPERLMMVVSFSPLIPIVSVRPLTAVEGDKRKPVRGVAQLLVTGKTKLYDPALAARFGHRDHSRLSLKVPKRFPSPWSIPKLSPNHRYDGSTLCSRQLLNKLSCRHRGEKTFNLLVVLLCRSERSLQLIEQHLDQLRLGSDHVLGNHKLRLFKLLPQLSTTCFTEMVLKLSESVPLLVAKLREGGWGRIVLEKIYCQPRFQIGKNLQGPRIVLFEGHLKLMEEPSFLPHHALLIAAEHLKLLGLLGIRLKGSQVSVIGPDKFREHAGVKGVALRLAHSKPIPSPIHGLGIDRVKHDPVVQKKIHNPPMGFLDPSPKLAPFSSSLIKPAPQLRHPFRGLFDLHLRYLLPVLITHVELVHSVCPVHSHIVSLHFLSLLRCVVPIPTTVNGMFALYRSSMGQLSIEPLAPFFYWSGQSQGDPHKQGSGHHGPHTSKLVAIGTTKMISYKTTFNRVNIRATHANPLGCLFPGSGPVIIFTSLCPRALSLLPLDEIHR